MKHFVKTLLLSVLALVLALAPAAAEDISFTGTVTAAFSHDVYAGFTGTVEQLGVQAGDAVEASAMVAALRTNKIYAETTGTVTAVFAQIGDAAETLTARYGASLFIDDGVHYTIAASSEGKMAYDSVDAKLVQPGEQVYLRSRSDKTRTGEGLVTAVDGSSYTVEVFSGEFIAAESVNIYRDAAYSDAQRIGRGSIANKAPLAVTCTGRILNVAVQAGDKVQRGDLLLETLEGSPDMSRMNARISSGVSGVVAEVCVAQGDTVAEGARIASIWPYDAMQIEVLIPEGDLGAIAAGDTVSIVFDWNEEQADPLQGVVTSIASAASTEIAATAYTATIAFTPDATVRYGMNVTVSPVR